MSPNARVALASPGHELWRPLEAEVTILDNGLKVVMAPSFRAPLVATALTYGVGTKAESHGLGGSAHFLEHMMFKGSELFPTGEIDRLTRALGGANNAFTTHDLTLYHFAFAADRWQQALAIEADRLAGLRLEAHEVDAERQVILEEITMYEDDPWDALDQAVAQTLFGTLPYGRPVLGTREELARIDGEVLRDFHRRFYAPGNATLTVVGAIEAGPTLERIAASLGRVQRPSEKLPTRPPERPTGGLRRVERRHGDLARLTIALPSPAADSVDHVRLRLLLAILGIGRASRLNRALVDEGKLCTFVAADLHETVDPGWAVFAAEVLPGQAPSRVEAILRSELDRLRMEPPNQDEIDRARRIYLADWLFGHEKVDQQAVLLGLSATLFDLDFPRRTFERLFAVTRDDLLAAAQTFLDLERDAVIGWSLPA